MPGIEFRRADAGDYPAAAALRQEMALEMGSDFDAIAADWRAKFTAYFSAKQSAGLAQLFLALDNSEPVGCATISILDDYRNAAFDIRTAHINAVFVRAAYRRRGIARELMRMALDWAREAGCTRVRLRASDDGRPLYEALGFRSGREMELRF